MAISSKSFRGIGGCLFALLPSVCIFLPIFFGVFFGLAYPEIVAKQTYQQINCTVISTEIDGTCSGTKSGTISYYKPIIKANCSGTEYTVYKMIYREDTWVKRSKVSDWLVDFQPGTEHTFWQNPKNHKNIIAVLEYSTRFWLSSVLTGILLLTPTVINIIIAIWIIFI